MKEIIKIWHYTIVNYLPSILKHGIRTANANIPKGEKPVVWFSINQIWEETANKGYISDGYWRPCDKEETKNHGGGLIRIEVSPKTAPIKWPQFVGMKHIKRKNAIDLHRAAILGGADPKDWRISLRKVTPEKFLSIEYFSSDESGWTDISEVLNPEYSEVIHNDQNITGVDLVNTLINKNLIAA